MAAVALALGGCGSNEERDEIRSVARSFMYALLEADWRGACGLMTDEARTGLPTPGIPDATCPQAMRQVFGLPAAQRRELRESFDFALALIEVDGDRARVRLQETFLPEGNEVLTLRKVGGVWRLG